MTPFACVVCGQSSVAAKRTRMYCSTTCKTKAHGERARERANQWYAENRERVAVRNGSRVQPKTTTSRRRWYRYGLTPEAEASILADQRGVCAICRRTKRLVVDHDHLTGAIRGLLCNSCNAGLGLFRDEELTLSRAINYLARPQVELTA